MAAKAKQLIIGSVVDDKYVIDNTIGGGAMSTVFAARHLETDDMVALKVLHPWVKDRKVAIARLIREGKLLSELDHPSCVRVLDWGVDGKRPYVALELVDGRGLDELIDEGGALGMKRSFAIALQLCDVLESAHELGIVHRDLKPENIMMIDDDAVKVLDFGLARLMPGSRGREETIPRQLTQPGDMLGTPTHMSPEQMKGEKADARTDIYAMGVILYEMLTGELPLVGDNPIATLVMLTNTVPEPPSTHVSDLPAAVDALVMRCLKKEPDERFQSAAALRDALREVANPKRPPVPLAYSTPKSSYSGWLLALALVALASAVIATFYVLNN